MTDEEIKLDNRKLHQRTALYWNNLANDRIKEVTLQLVSLAAILLPISASVIALNQSLDLTQQLLLILSWVFLLASLVSGIIQIYADAHYFNGLANDESYRETLYSQKNKTLTAIEVEEKKKLQTNPYSKDFLPLQAILLCFGLLLLMVMATTLLFTKTPNPMHTVLLNTSGYTYKHCYPNLRK